MSDLRGEAKKRVFECGDVGPNTGNPTSMSRGGGGAKVPLLP